MSSRPSPAARSSRPSSSLRLLVLLLTLVAAAGCGPSEEGTTDPPPGSAPTPQAGCDRFAALAASPQEVDPGASIALTVENTGQTTLTYGLSGRIERVRAGRWVDASDAMVSRAVPEIAVVVRPGDRSAGGAGATADVVELSPDAEPGPYRVLKDVTASEPGAGRAHQATLCAAFSVR
jgi:hypothetical protein